MVIELHLGLILTIPEKPLLPGRQSWQYSTLDLIVVLAAVEEDFSRQTASNPASGLQPPIT